MARSRNIKPGFFKNEQLASLPFEYRLLFIGLWTVADREGRFEDRPIRIRMEVFPADDVDVEAGLQALHAAGFIVRYERDGQRFGQIPAWSKHQNPHFREKESTIPPPQSPGLDAGSIHPKPEALHSLQDGQALGKPEALPASQGGQAGLIPDSLIPDSKALAQRAERSTDPAADFERFWSAYPRRVGKRAAVKAFAKLRPGEALMGAMLAAVDRQRQSDQWQRDGGQYIPHAATWLNGRRWEDEAEPARDGAHGAPGSDGENWLRRAV